MAEIYVFENENAFWEWQAANPGHDDLVWGTDAYENIDDAVAKALAVPDSKVEIFSGAFTNPSFKGVPVVIHGGTFTNGFRSGMSGGSLKSTNVVIDGGDFVFTGTSNIQAGGGTVDGISSIEIKNATFDNSKGNTVRILGGGAGDGGSSSGTSITISNVTLLRKATVFGGGYNKNKVNGDVHIDISYLNLDNNRSNYMTVYGGGYAQDNTTSSANISGSVYMDLSHASFDSVYGSGSSAGTIDGNVRITLSDATVGYGAGNKQLAVSSGNNATIGGNAEIIIKDGSEILVTVALGTVSSGSNAVVAGNSVLSVYDTSILRNGITAYQVGGDVTVNLYGGTVNGHISGGTLSGTDTLNFFTAYTVTGTVSNFEVINFTEGNLVAFSSKQNFSNVNLTIAVDFSSISAENKYVIATGVFTFDEKTVFTINSANYSLGDVIDGKYIFDYADNALQIIEFRKGTADGRVYLNTDWAGKKSGSMVLVNGLAYEFGTDAFASLDDARGALKNGDFIEVAGGVYSDAFYLGGSSDIRFGGGSFSKDLYGADNSVSGFTGDTSVRIIEGVVSGDVFGGGQNSFVTGDTSVEVSGGEVAGDVLGGGNNSGVSGTASVVIGTAKVGSIYGAGYFPGASDVVTVGAVSVAVNGGTVDSIYGGGYSRGSHLEVTGKVSVEVNENSTVSGDIYGGTLLTLGAASIASVSATEVRITGGAVGGAVYGAGFVGAEGVEEIGTASIRVSGGTVAKALYGGGFATGGEAVLSIGTASVEVSGGTVKDIYSGTDIGGSLIDGNTPDGADTKEECNAVIENSSVRISGTARVNSILGGGMNDYIKNSEISVSGGSVGSIYGGGYGYNRSSNRIKGNSWVDNSSILISGGTVRGNIYGGGLANAATSASERSYSSTVDSVTIVISGGEVAGSIYAGGGSANTTVANAAVKITGGNIEGNLYGNGETGAIVGSSILDIGSADAERFVTSYEDKIIDNFKTINVVNADVTFNSGVVIGESQHDGVFRVGTWSPAAGSDSAENSASVVMNDGSSLTASGIYIGSEHEIFAAGTSSLVVNQGASIRTTNETLNVRYDGYLKFDHAADSTVTIFNIGGNADIIATNLSGDSLQVAGDVTLASYSTPVVASFSDGATLALKNGIVVGPKKDREGTLKIDNSTITTHGGTVIGGNESGEGVGHLRLSGGACLCTEDFSVNALSDVSLEVGSLISFSGTWANAGTVTVKGDLSSLADGRYKLVDYTGSGTVADYGNFTVENGTDDFSFKVMDNDLYLVKGNRPKLYVNSKYTTAEAAKEDGHELGYDAFADVASAVGASDGETIQVNGGTFSSSMFFSGNAGEIIDGTFTGIIYGGANKSAVNGDTGIKISGGKINTSVYGGGLNSVVSGSSSVEISGGSINGSIYGGGTGGAQVDGTASVKITGDDIKINGYIFAGSQNTATVNNGTLLEITGGETGSITINNQAFGGGSAAGADDINIVNGGTRVIIRNTALNTPSGSYSMVLGGGKAELTWADAEKNPNASPRVEVHGGTRVEVSDTRTDIDPAEAGLRVYGGGWSRQSQAVSVVTGGTEVLVSSGKLMIVGGGGVTSGSVGAAASRSYVDYSNVNMTGGEVSRILFAGGYSNCFGNSYIGVEDSTAADGVKAAQLPSGVEYAASLTIQNTLISGGVVAGGGYRDWGYVDNVGEDIYKLQTQRADVYGNTKVEFISGSVVADEIDGYCPVSGFTGGGYALVNGSKEVSADVYGNTSIDIKDGTINTNVYGGGLLSYFGPDTDMGEDFYAVTGYARVFGNTSIVISGGMINGNVYAGGGIFNAEKAFEGSVFNADVSGNASVTLTGGTVSGMISGSGANGGTVTGSSTLNLGSAEVAYNAAFETGKIADFDTVNIVNGTISFSDGLENTDVTLTDNAVLNVTSALTVGSLTGGAGELNLSADYKLTSAGTVDVGTVNLTVDPANIAGATTYTFISAAGINAGAYTLNGQACTLGETFVIGGYRYLLQIQNDGLELSVDTAVPPIFKTAPVCVQQAGGYNFTVSAQAVGPAAIDFYSLSTDLADGKITIDTENGLKFVLNDNTVKSFKLYVTAKDVTGLFSDTVELTVDVLDYTAPEITQAFAAQGDQNYVVSLSVDGTDNFGGPLSYEYRYAFSQNGLSSAQTVSGSEFSVTAADAGKTVYIEVRAKDEAGNISGWTSVQPVVLKDITAPVITGYRFAQQSGGYVFDVSVQATDNVAVTATGFRYAATKDELETADILTGDTLTLTSADAGKTYYYQVMAKDAAGNITWSDAVEFTVNNYTAPIFLSTPTVAQSADGYTFSIHAEAISPDSTIHYEYRYADNADMLNAVVMSTNQFTLEADSATKTYYVQARASDSAGNTSAWTTPVATVVSKDVTAPVIISSSADQKLKGFDFTFTVNAYDNVSVAGTFYRFAETREALAGEGVSTSIVLSLSADDAGKQFFYQVRAKDEAGNYSDWSDAQAFTVTADKGGSPITAPVVEPTITTDAETGRKTGTVELGADEDSKIVVNNDVKASYLQIQHEEASKTSITIDGLEKGEKIKVSLLDKNGRKIKQVSVTANKNGKAAIDGVLTEAGTCYISVECANNKTDTAISMKVENEYFAPRTENKDLATAADIALEEKVVDTTTVRQGVVSGWVGYGNELETHTFSNDYARELTIRLSDIEEGAKVRITLQDALGNKIRSYTVSEKDLRKKNGFEKTILLDAGTNFVVVEAYDKGKGKYNGAYNFVATEKVFDKVTDDSKLNPTVVVWESDSEGRKTAAVDGWVGYSDASDFYKFDILGGNVGFNLTGLEDEYKAGKQVKLSLVNLDTGKKISLKSVKGDDAMNFMTSQKNGLAGGSYCAIVQVSNQKKYASDYSLGITSI